MINIPNILTIFRFFLVPTYLFIYFSDIPSKLFWSVAIILLAGITDVVDGYIARRYNLVTEIGSLLDPLADKLMIIAVFLSLLITHKITLWAAFAVFLRDISMIIYSTLFHLKGKKTIPANIMGKLTTVLFYIALFTLLFSINGAQTFLWFVIGLSYLTSLIYFVLIRSANKE
ncbi:CDP-diacylglycerol--glycerol-3-phosphate 3-phosphatidyltransferase [Shimazuella soli]|uniref:CDP-diacylglycerol--glycerol-3-phosphate 3-phosphatidyltransferase n=1 Tax=Shimazuella soli TaxID=1892854 RepID=UPI0021031A44|nr:CDP-diacylglycerol--glycerol-3-phosphate 3-phosphatidyltransferase [Shimazuella soli]